MVAADADGNWSAVLQQPTYGQLRALKLQRHTDR